MTKEEFLVFLDSIAVPLFSNTVRRASLSRCLWCLRLLSGRLYIPDVLFKHNSSDVFPFSELPNISYDAGPNYWKTRLWIFRRWGKIHFPPFAPRNSLTLARWPLFASYLQNTKFKMKRSKICRKQIFPSCLGLKIMGTGFGRKYLKNPTLPLLQQRWEGRRGKFWVRQTIPLFSHPQSGKIHLRFRRQNWDQMFKCWQLRVERPDGISVGNWAASEWTFPCYGILWNGLSAHKPCSRSHIYIYIYFSQLWW